MLALTQEAAKGGVWLRQLSPGRDIALTPQAPEERLVFTAAASMRNYIYLVGDATSRVCYCVDACWDPAGIARYAEHHKMRLVGSIASHYHYDHCGGTVPPQLVAMMFGPFGAPKDPYIPGIKDMKKFGCKLYAHASEVGRIVSQCTCAESDFTGLQQGSKLPLGEAGHIEVFHTPGHSGGSICLSVTPKGAKPMALVVGDTIFPGSCGRLDLPDSDTGAMFESLQKLRELPDDLSVYPGHSYGGEKTTIAAEKRNGLLRPFTREQWRQMHG